VVVPCCDNDMRTPVAQQVAGRPRAALSLRRYVDEDRPRRLNYTSFEQYAKSQM